MSAIAAAAELVVQLERLNDHSRGETGNVGTVAGGTSRNVVPAFCSMRVDTCFPDIASGEHLMRLRGASPHRDARE